MPTDRAAPPPKDKLPWSRLPQASPGPVNHNFNIELEALSSKSGSSPVLLSPPSSRPLSRSSSPFTLLAPSRRQPRHGGAANSVAAVRDRTAVSPHIHSAVEEEDASDQESEGFDDWNVENGEEPVQDDFDQVDDDSDMPSDLRSHLHRHHEGRQPLLSSKDGRPSYDGPVRPSLSRRSTMHERDPDVEARNATRRRYMYAACFLVLSLISFAVQTETAVYIQRQLHWEKAYCMLYFTHGSWSLLWPIQLLILRIQKWNTPWKTFWRRHYALIRQTAQMVRYQTLHPYGRQATESPWPHMVRTTAFVTCALTVAGASWYVAVNLTTASDLTAIYNCSAFFAYAFSVPLLHEKVRASKVVAVAIAIAGVLVVSYGGSAESHTPKHGGKSGGGAGGPDHPDRSDHPLRALGNIVIGIGSVLYGFYEVLYKRVACPPEECSPGRGMIFANAFGSMIGVFTLTVLWIPLPILHFTGIETFELPRGEAAWMMLISVLANATFSGSFLVLISLTSPVLSSVAALLTIFIVAIIDQLLPPPLNSPLSGAAIAGGCLIILAFLLLSWSTYREMDEERRKKIEVDDMVSESDID